MDLTKDPAPPTWRDRVPSGIRPYVEPAPLAALFLGISSAFPFTMIGATLSTMLRENEVNRGTVTAFALTFLAYNFKFIWAPFIDTVRLPFLHRFGQRRSWLWLIGIITMATVIYLGTRDPRADINSVIVAAIIVAVAGATYDIIIDAYRIELLKPEQLGAGAGMSQYGWRIGSAAAGGLALVVAQYYGWAAGYAVCVLFALPAMLVALVMGEPTRHREPPPIRSPVQAVIAYFSPLAEFLKRRGAILVLIFVLIHKIGDTLANLTLRLLFEDMGFSKEEVAYYDVAVGLVALLVGVFVGGILYAKLGMKRSVLISLILMAVSNFGFALLASSSKSNEMMAAVMAFENFASGIGGVAVVAYLSALCNLRFTATQYALLSAAASIVGRSVTGTSAGGMIDQIGYVNYYLFTTAIAFPGVILFWVMMRAGLVDDSLGDAGTVEPAEARDDPPTAGPRLDKPEA